MEKIIALCKKYKVAKLWVFGSILTARFNEDSDVDLSVSFDKGNINLEDYADNYFDFMDELKSLFRREIDLVCDDSVKIHISAKSWIALKYRFMDNRVLKYLSDVLTAVNEIDEETAIRGKQFEIICSDRVYRNLLNETLA